MTIATQAEAIQISAEAIQHITTEEQIRLFQEEAILKTKITVPLQEAQIQTLVDSTTQIVTKIILLLDQIVLIATKEAVIAIAEDHLVVHHLVVVDHLAAVAEEVEEDKSIIYKKNQNEKTPNFIVNQFNFWYCSISRNN